MLLAGIKEASNAPQNDLLTDNPVGDVVVGDDGDFMSEESFRNTLKGMQSKESEMSPAFDNSQANANSEADSLRARLIEAE